MLESQRDVVQPLHEGPAHIVVDLERGAHAPGLDGALPKVDRDLRAGLSLQDLPQLLGIVLADHASHEALFPRIAAEDVGEARGQHDFEAVVLQRPHGMLARGTGPEVGPGHKNAGTLVSVLIEDEVGLVRPPTGEERILEARAGDALEVDGGNDLVGVHSAASQRGANTGMANELLHESRASLSGSGRGGRGQVRGG